MRIFCWIVIGLWMGTAVFAAGDIDMGKTHRILYITSFHSSYEWTEKVEAGLFQYLNKSFFQFSIDTFELNTLQETDPVDWQRKFELCLPLIQRGDYEVVIVGSNNAIELLRRNMDRIPKNLPVIFCSYFHYNPQILKEHPNTTGLICDNEAVKTINLGLRLLPQTQKVAFISDGSTGGKTFRDDLRKQWNNRSVEIVYYDGSEMNTARMLSELKNLPADSFIVFSNWNITKNENYRSLRVIVSQIEAQSGKAVFTTTDSVSDYAVAGGIYPLGFEYGETIGRLVERIVSGESAADIPVTRPEPRIVLNWDILKKFDIDPSRAPKTAVWRNAPDSFGSRYRHALLTTGILAALIVVAFLLYWLLLSKRVRQFFGDMTHADDTVFLQSILANMPCAVFVKDYADDGKYIVANKHFQERHNLIDCGIIGKTDYDIFNKKDAKKFRDSDREVLKNNLVEESIDEIHGEERRYMQTRKVCLELSNGKKLLLGMSLDMTALAESRNELVRAKGILDAVLNNFPAYVFARYNNEDSKYVIWNLNMEILTGIPSFRAINTPASRINQIIPIKPHLPSFEEEITDVNGNKKFLSVINSIIMLPENRNLLLTMAVDITNTKAAERAKSYFLATMSHELRTPLNAVIGFSELLQNKELPQAERDEYLQSINFAGKALLNLINDILDLSKLEANQMTIIPERLDFYKLCCEIHAIFIHQAAQKQLKLELDCPDNLPMLHIDGSRMRHILLNLIGNAIKFTESGSVITRIRFRKIDGESGTLTINIIDTGLGIAKEAQKKIFEPFVQLNVVRGSRYNRGTGLGLTISKQLVEKMGGNMTLESQLGEGSNFTVVLNRVHFDENKYTSVPDAPPDGVLRRHGILIVDDVGMNLALLAAMLQKLNQKVFTAGSGEEALSILNERAADISLVLTDMWMPQMNGAELAAKIRGNAACDPIALYALTADTESGESFDLANFKAVITKPVTLEKLKNIL